MGLLANYKPRQPGRAAPARSDSRTWFDDLFADPAKSFAASALRLPETGLDFLDYVGSLSGSDLVDEEEWARKLGISKLSEIAANTQPDAPRNFVGKVGQAVGGAIPDLAAVLGGAAGAVAAAPATASVATAGAIGGIGTAFGLVSSRSYREARDRGLTPGQAAAKATASGAAGGALEYVGARKLGALLKAIPGKHRLPFVQQWGAATGTEVGTEMAQEIVELGLESATGKDITPDEVKDRIATSGAAALVIGGGAGAVGLGAHGQPGAWSGTNLTAKGGIGERAHELVEAVKFGRSKDVMEARFIGQSHMKEKNAYIKQFEKKEQKGERWKLDENIYNYMNAARGTPDSARLAAEIPAPMLPTVDKAKELLLSHTDQLLASGDLTNAQQAALEKWRDAYIRRSFRLHTEGGDALMQEFAPHLGTTWLKKAEPSAEWVEARKYIKNDYAIRNPNLPRLDDVQADQELTQLFGGDIGNTVASPGSSAQSISGGEKIEKGSLKHRDEIPLELRRIFGEKINLEDALVESVAYTSALSRQMQFYRDLVQGGIASEAARRQVDAGVTGKGEMPSEIPLFSSKPSGPGGHYDVNLKTEMRSREGTAKGTFAELALIAQRGKLAGGRKRVVPLEGVQAQETGGTLQPLQTEAKIILDRDGKIQFKELGKIAKEMPDLYMNRNVLEAMDRQLNTNPWMGIAQDAGPLLKAWKKALQVVGGSKMGLTVLQPTAQIRNLQSNIFAILAGGHDLAGRAYRTVSGYKPAFDVDVDPFRDAAVQQDLMSPEEAAKRQYLRKLRGKKQRTPEDVEAAVLEQEELGVGTLGVQIEPGPQEFFAGIENLAESKRALIGVPMKGIKFLGKTWAWGDTSFRKLAYKLELQNLEAQHHDNLELARTGEGFNGISFNDYVYKLKKQASERAAQTIQNYERLPNVVKWMRANPIIAPFASFPTAVVINAKNQVKLAMEDMGLAPPTTRDASLPSGKKGVAFTQGAQRLAGTVSATAGAGAVVRGIIDAIMTGIGMERPEPDEQHLQDMLTVSPFWAKASDLILLGSEPGQDHYYDLSFSSYFDTLARPVRASLRAGQLDENAFEFALEEVLEPFLSPEIMTGAILEAYKNENRYGRPIRDETDPVVEQLQDAAEHVFLSFAGPVNVVRRIYKASQGDGDPLSERDISKLWPELAALSGVRVTNIDYTKKFQQALWNHKDVIRQVDRAVSQALTSKTSSTEEQLAHAVVFRQEAALKMFRHLRSVYEAAERRGAYKAVLDQIIKNAVDDGNIRKSEAAMARGLISPEAAAQMWARTKIPNANENRRKRRQEKYRVGRVKLEQSGKWTPQEDRALLERINRQWPMIPMGLIQ